MEGQILFAIVFVIGMFCGVFIIFMGLRQRSAQLEMHHRERMAMIEKGQIPLSDPSSLHARRVVTGPRATYSKYMTAGILVVGLGLSIMTIISLAADEPEIGVGVGGAIAVLGAAFLVRGVVVKNEHFSTEVVPGPDDHAL
jgi:hypothetical protein